MYLAMESNPKVYVDEGSEGLERVKGDGGDGEEYAYIMEAAAIEYHKERNCNLTQIGGLLDSKGYGIALPMGEDILIDLGAVIFIVYSCSLVLIV